MAKFWKSCLMIIILQGCGQHCFGAENSWISDEHTLYNDLMKVKDYNKFIRPAKSEKSKIVVKFGMALIKLIEVDEKIGSVTGQFWLRMLWNDERLKWDPKTYNVTAIRIPATQLWNPDIYLYNAARGTGELDISGVFAVVYNTGDVLCIPPVIVEAMCAMDMSQFPFDTQTCTFKYGSWVYSGKELDLEFYEGQNNVDLTDLVYNIEWHITNTTAKKYMKYYPCCVEPYPDMKFNITMTRRSKYFSDIFIGPGLILALLTPFIFVLPPKGPHKINLAGFLFMMMLILYNSLEVVYASSVGQTPLLIRYYTTIFVDLALAVVVAVISSKAASRASFGNAPPAIIKKIFADIIGRFLCVSPNHEVDTEVSVGGTGDDTHDTIRIVEPAGQVLHARDWMTISRVLDRLAFIVFMFLSIVFAIVFLSH